MADTQSIEPHASHRVKHVDSNNQRKMDVDELGQMICCMQIYELEKRLEDFFKDAEQKLSIISKLQKLKQLVIQAKDKSSIENDNELADLIKFAKEHGLVWNKTGWENKDDKSALLDDIHALITSLESKNQTHYMQINRLMSLRTEKSNLFSRLSNDVNQQKLRILGRIDKRS